MGIWQRSISACGILQFGSRDDARGDAAQHGAEPALVAEDIDPEAGQPRHLVGEIGVLGLGEFIAVALGHDGFDLGFQPRLGDRRLAGNGDDLPVHAQQRRAAGGKVQVRGFFLDHFEKQIIEAYGFARAKRFGLFTRLAFAKHDVVVGDQCQVNCAVFPDLVDLQSRIRDALLAGESLRKFHVDALEGLVIQGLFQQKALLAAAKNVRGFIAVDHQCFAPGFDQGID